MDNISKADRDSVRTETEENGKNVRGMVMESYRDMKSGKGRDYRAFFSEMKNRYC